MCVLLQVSDTDFSLHASYDIMFFWEDDRVFVDDPDPLAYYILDTSLFEKFWSPRNKVNVRHAKESRQNAGLVFHQTSFGLSRGTVGGNWSFDVSISIKPEITCPMDFSWFPFDTQECHFVINAGEPNIRLINSKPYNEGSKPKRQNTQLEYDITIQELPEHMQKNTDIEVKYQQQKERLAKKTNLVSFFQEWGEIIETIWPDLTEEVLALWKDVGVTFKMRRRYHKFVLLYYLPRFP